MGSRPARRHPARAADRRPVAVPRPRRAGSAGPRRAGPAGRLDRALGGLVGGAVAGGGRVRSPRPLPAGLRRLRLSGPHHQASAAHGPRAGRRHRAGVCGGPARPPAAGRLPVGRGPRRLRARPPGHLRQHARAARGARDGPVPARECRRCGAPGGAAARGRGGSAAGDHARADRLARCSAGGSRGSPGLRGRRPPAAARGCPRGRRADGGARGGGGARRSRAGDCGRDERARARRRTHGGDGGDPVDGQRRAPALARPALRRRRRRLPGDAGRRRGLGRRSPSPPRSRRSRSSAGCC